MDERSGGRSPRRQKRQRGEVRQAAMKAALRAIEEAGTPSLTLREVANEIGVVHSALYRHFPSRGELLAAVAEQGFRDFLVALRPSDGTGSASDQLKSLCRTHLAFALENGPLYKVMFGSDVVPFDVEGTPFHAAATDVLGIAVTAIAKCQRAGILRGEEPMAPTLVFWSMLHGLAMLAIDGRLEPKLSDERSVESILDLALGGLLIGLGGRE